MTERETRSPSGKPADDGTALAWTRRWNEMNMVCTFEEERHLSKMVSICTDFSWTNSSWVSIALNSSEKCSFDYGTESLHTS